MIIVNIMKWNFNYIILLLIKLILINDVKYIIVSIYWINNNRNLMNELF